MIQQLNHQRSENKFWAVVCCHDDQRLRFPCPTLQTYSEYFSDRPLERLIGANIKAKKLNDDALGRCLDELYELYELYEHGVSSFYQDIGEKVVDHLGLECRSTHLDSASFHYDGTEKLCQMTMILTILKSEKATFDIIDQNLIRWC